MKQETRQNHIQELLPQAKIWQKVNRELCAKIFSEFMYEEIIHPLQKGETETGLQIFELTLGEGVCYRFSAKKRLYFNFYRVLPESIERTDAAALKVSTLILELHNFFQLKPEITAMALRELSGTISADAWMAANENRIAAKDWPNTPDYLLEGELNAHPWIVANKSRLGFSASEYLKYAPEQKQPFRLRWLALKKERSNKAWVLEKDKRLLESGELTAEMQKNFQEQLAAMEKSPQDYDFLPVHPWQFENRILTLFATDFAEANLVDMGEGDDLYLPQQSIRTLNNISRKNRPYVKLPVSILNTSVYRGLPAERTKNAPKLSHWLASIAKKDVYLRDVTRVVLLSESASITVEHPEYSSMKDVPYQYNEYLGVIYRENCSEYLDPGERALPLAALFHRDTAGDSVLQVLVAESGLSAQAWTEKFMDAVLHPLLHFLYKYGFVFSPHGQNALIALQDNVPTRLFVKDFVDDANLCIDPLPEHEDLPEELYDLLDSLEAQVLIQWIQSGLFVCVFRYITEILEDDALLSEKEFWAIVVKSIQGYQDQFPDLTDRFEHFDLFKPAFPKLCLNSTRLLDIGYEDSAERPVASVTGLVDNPLYLAKKQQEVLV
ncbi:MAG: IucA/IucC family siderophore biosynthesis protein [Spirochaetota bacterium]